MSDKSDAALARLLQAQFDEELAQQVSSNFDPGGGFTDSHSDSSSNPLVQTSPLSIIDQKWELIDPTPDIRALFLQYNDQFFWGRLAGIEVKWSPRMTLCAGLCCYEGYGGLCSIRLSTPLLKLRPRKDLVETLLHEMIHAYLFVTQNNKDHDGHGPEFCKHMDRINTATGTKISIYHNFHDEVDVYKVHWWKCDGPCQKRPPYFGVVKRSMNRAPGPSDTWYSRHQASCGGTFTKIKEPEGFGTKKRKKGEESEKGKSSNKKQKTYGADIRNFIPFSGKGIRLGDAGNSTNKVSVTQVGATNSTKNVENPSRLIQNSGNIDSPSSIHGSGGIWGGKFGKESEWSYSSKDRDRANSNATPAERPRKENNLTGDLPTKKSSTPSKSREVGHIDQEIHLDKLEGSDKENERGTNQRLCKADQSNLPINSSDSTANLDTKSGQKKKKKSKVLNWISKPEDAVSERQKLLEEKRAKVQKLRDIFSSSSDDDTGTSSKCPSYGDTPKSTEQRNSQEKVQTGSLIWPQETFNDIVEIRDSSDEDADQNPVKDNRPKTERASSHDDSMNMSLEDIFAKMRRKSGQSSGSASGSKLTSLSPNHFPGNVVFVDCPSCVKKIPESEINAHLDKCLAF